MYIMLFILLVGQNTLLYIGEGRACIDRATVLERGDGVAVEVCIYIYIYA